jgi:hypothetical protein
MFYVKGSFLAQSKLTHLSMVKSLDKIKIMQKIKTALLSYGMSEKYSMHHF